MWAGHRLLTTTATASVLLRAPARAPVVLATATRSIALTTTTMMARPSVTCSAVQLLAQTRRFASSSNGSSNSTRPPSTQQQRQTPYHAYGKLGEQYARHHQHRNRTGLNYSAAVFIFFLGLSYTAVPLYRLFCSATGVGGTVQTSLDARESDPRFRPDNMIPVRSSNRKLRITFNSDTARALNWSFRPQQRAVEVVPGETALAFYTAKNKGTEDVIGIATYNVVPAHAGPYFNKIQCFCFEEQKLRKGEEVDMPVFFFIDPAFLDDPDTQDISEITLSYTFFNARAIDANRLHALNPDAQAVAQNAIDAGNRLGETEDEVTSVVS
ncbi:cytochrome c oxidase assembly protein CtaG/Cox11-domain-containing protein [Blastocladiella britannica]|nr:cytochrome c oxidase assembly protein CtaG/Cox11-domain-containing protein [Blastocladiella britannica]